MSRIKKIILICTATLVVFGLFAGFLRGKYVPPILMYHMVVPGYKYALCVSDKTFEKQMKFLKDHRYNVVTLDQMVTLISSHKKIPAFGKPVVSQRRFKVMFIVSHLSELIIILYPFFTLYIPSFEATQISLSFLSF